MVLHCTAEGLRSAGWTCLGEHVHPVSFLYPGLDPLPRTRLVKRIALYLLPLILLAGCSPSITPLFRDFEVAAGEPAEPSEIAAALSAAGWTLVSEENAPAIRTEPRAFRKRLISHTEARLEAIPMGGQYVRVLIRADRVYVTGHRGPLGYLPEGVRREIVPPLRAAFAEHGMVLVPTTVERP
jgi:hypothetical protein